MKIILILFSIGLSISSFGQKILNYDKPSVYLDSYKIELEHYLFDQNNIARVDVIRKEFDPSTNTSGKTYITSKNPKDFNFLSFADLKSKYFGNNKKPVLLLLNGNFIKNPSQINIDSSYIYKVEVESGADFEELKNIYPLLAIVNIQTKNREILNDERNINIDSPHKQIFLLNGLPDKNFYIEPK